MSDEGSSESEATPRDLPDSDDGWEGLRSVAEILADQQTAAREKVRAAMKAADVPLPNAVVTKLAQLNPQDVREVLVDHPGFKASEQLGSYRISLRVFHRAVADLIRVIERFEAAVDDDIMSPRQRDKLDDIEDGVQKELFAAANAAHSLDDHSRLRIQPLVNIPGYKAKQRECFGDVGLREFVMGLRTVKHHLHMIETGWNIKNNFEKGKKASFTLNRDHVRFVVVRLVDSFRSKAHHAHILAYVSTAPEVIDLKKLFEEYQRRAADFHAWYGAALASDNLIELRDCERCLRENKKFGARRFWKAMLGNWLNWKEPPNPYDHLRHYLTPEQIEEVYRLPMQSEEQVDKVIELVDSDRACDADLRGMTYQLFRRAAPPALHVT